VKKTIFNAAGMWVALLLVLGLAAGCGTDGDTAVDAADTAEETTDASGDGDVEVDDAEADADTDAGEADADGDTDADAEGSAESVEAPSADEVPSRIVSLSPTATEMLYAIGAGEQVVAVDLYSNYPAEAPEGTLDGFVPDLEAIVAAEPELVVTSGLPPDVEAGLGELGITVLTQAAATGLDDVYAQIADLGIATGEASDLARSAAALSVLHGGLERIDVALELARRASRALSRNLALALGYNALLLPAAVLGFLHPITAVIAMVASSLSVSLSSLWLARRPRAGG